MTHPDLAELHALVRGWREHAKTVGEFRVYEQGERIFNRCADELAAALRKIEQEGGARNVSEAETGAMLCRIVEADFEKNLVTLQMAGAYSVSMGSYELIRCATSAAQPRDVRAPAKSEPQR